MTSFTAHSGRDTEALRREARPLFAPDDYDEILAWIGDASVVLLGEATHGTHEFYEARALITRLLMERSGFSAVAIEGDWPDAYRVNRYVHMSPPSGEAVDALGGFERFPTWMWRNTVIVEFISWLRARNAMMDPANQAGFYGLDLYSLRSSMQAVVDYLEKRDPNAARSARKSYGCFDQFGGDNETYSWAASRTGGTEGLCAEAVTRELLSLREHRAAFLRHDGSAAADEFFYAEQNARLARNAELYYRTMFKGRVASWNIRDKHMAETLDELLAHLKSRGQSPKIVVWAHNSHLGDARATEMSDDGEINLGQQVRQRHGGNARLIGFSTHHGTVIAASDWGEPAQRMQVRPALEGSWESLFHETRLGRFFLPFTQGSDAFTVLAKRRLERAIGVVYRPETERLSHYFNARLAHQFDAVIHFDGTTALQPLERRQPPVGAEIPETFPSGV
jgi:erythromycin esterase-like protein